MPEKRHPKAQEIRDARSREILARLDQVSRIQVPYPLGVGYPTLVIDPPWPITKIKRDCRPNQVHFDYPTMTVAEIGALPVGQIAGPDAHLFLWTTQKFLMTCDSLLRGWGFKYVLTFTWDKGGGFQPIGLPQYSSEFVVYGRRGSVRFLETKAFKTCFQAPRQGHSIKPDQFYETIARVCPGPRLDMFSRQNRPGYTSWGNELPSPPPDPPDIG